MHIWRQSSISFLSRFATLTPTITILFSAMPQKTTNARAWGTRFDTLPSSPPSSPPPPNAEVIGGTPSADASTYKKTEKAVTPHDASVFVGSLPTNIEHNELTRLLGEHLSEHTEIKNLKIIRDSKGGVCAFVQCEDATAAASLIHTLQTSVPKPFFGRILRYEPARAFRTLFISYRPPIQYKSDGEAIALDLPHAMRMWRPRNTKYLSILYNNEAIEAENSAVCDPNCEPVLFLQPVILDQTTLERLCAHFGPLEHFSVLNKLNVEEDQEVKSTTRSYPQPHDGPRLPGMNPGCFEVKWVHRDDSVSALMTLRRVPHLTVSWAHQPQSGPDFYQNRPPSNHPLDVQNNARASSNHPTPIMPSETDVFSNSRASPENWNANGSFDETKAGVEWTSDVHFPPLGDRKSDRRAQRGVWADNKKPSAHAALEPTESRPSSALSVVIAGKNGHNELSTTASVEENENTQEGDEPETPGLGMSPVTPKTNDSQQFPTTPATSVSEDDTTGKDASYFPGGEPKGIDPTSLFVGGLEMYGPDAWDEHRVTALFEKYGGLQSVRVVKPTNAKAAFAFVKFNNTESPARAVMNEHNSVHHGRTIRVQLRDCNPPRGSFRFHGRGTARGRHPHMNYGQRRFQENPEGDIMASNQVGHRQSTAEFEQSKFEAQSRSAPVSRHTSPEPEIKLEQATGEWYDQPTSATMTPPPHAGIPLGSGSPYPMPGGGYYQAPWPHAFPQQVPYVSYYPGYPAGYPMPTHQGHHSQQFASPVGSDASGPASAAPRPWPMYGYYNLPYPYATAQTSGEKSPSQSQAPLQPTGFIQNGAGTLIPLYQPEALDHYMTSNHINQSVSAQTQQPVPQQQGPPAVPVAHGTPQFAQYAPPGYAYPNAMPPMMGMQPRPFPAMTEAAWVAQSQVMLSQGNSPNIPSLPFRGQQFPDVNAGNNGPNNNRRQGPGGRRDQGGHNRGGQPKGMAGRQHQNRAGGSLQFHPNGELPQHLPRAPQFPTLATDHGHGQWISTTAHQ
ncbi:RNA binding protein [Mycena indigotica]|uniref:RNA binding protein n=1 Tax=Mycena indigotica TaxID=2126181 RepID=A0A8H6WC90_9AGAR|nr:RNA binding protein [Mycena indigotica]KAF7307104.1 RNA binding protein [Mycena indigotica]